MRFRWSHKNVSFIPARVSFSSDYDHSVQLVYNSLIPRFDFGSFFFYILFIGDLWKRFGEPGVPLFWVKKFQKEEKRGRARIPPLPHLTSRSGFITASPRVPSVSNYIVILKLRTL